MNKIAFAVFALFTSAALSQELSELALPPNGDNQKAQVSQWIGPVRVTVTWHSPHVHNPAANDRTGHIWGELVPYGLFDDGFGPSTAIPWRAGANESSTIEFSHDVQVQGKPVKAGTYALFLETQKEGPWQWILSSHTGWGSYQYDPKYDVARLPATPADAPFTEYLTYAFDDRRPDSAVAYLQWEKKRIPMKIEVPNVNALYVDQMRQDLQAWPGFNYRNWQAAAQFCADHKINLEEALVWADRATTVVFRGAALGHEDFSTLQTKANVLKAMGRDAVADATMQRAIRIPGTDAALVYRYGMTLLSAAKTQQAVEIFNLNRQQHPDDNFWVPLGLARAYTATGDKKAAIGNWEIVLKNVPPALKNNIPRFELELQKLK